MPKKKDTVVSETAVETAEETITSEETEETAVETAEETIESEKPAITEVMVFNKHRALVRTYTADDGLDFVDQAHALVSQPRRVGWTVQVR